MSSDKTVVVEYIWHALQSEGQGRRIVYFDDIVAAIQACNAKDGRNRSAKNPANFMKDLVRKDRSSHNWPESLSQIKIGGRQRVGSDRVFEFIDFAEGQTEPFPNRYFPNPELVPIRLQSVSLPLASKALGRKDESWLIQVAVALGVLEQHLALSSSLQVRELVHLQTGVKLANSEIDGLFRAIVEGESGSRRDILLTCEAKQHGERILEHQIVEQIVAATKSVNSSVSKEDMDVAYIVPLALKAIGNEGDVYVVEFEPWSLTEASAEESNLKELAVASEGLYRLVPPVPGIGYVARRRRAK